MGEQRPQQESLFIHPKKRTIYPNIIMFLDKMCMYILQPKIAANLNSRQKVLLATNPENLLLKVNYWQPDLTGGQKFGCNRAFFL